MVENLWFDFEHKGKRDKKSHAARLFIVGPSDVMEQALRESQSESPRLGDNGAFQYGRNHEKFTDIWCLNGAAIGQLGIDAKEHALRGINSFVHRLVWLSLARGVKPDPRLQIMQYERESARGNYEIVAKVEKLPARKDAAQKVAGYMVALASDMEAYHKKTSEIVSAEIDAGAPMAILKAGSQLLESYRPYGEHRIAMANSGLGTEASAVILLAGLVALARADQLA